MKNKQKHIISLIILSILIVFPSVEGEAQIKNKGMENKQRTARTFRYIADKSPEYTAKLAKEVFALCPPLYPERFDRRMWRLWGLKVSDYPLDDSDRYPFGTYIVPSHDDYTKPTTIPPNISSFIMPDDSPYPLSDKNRIGAGWLSTWLKYGRDDINKNIVGELYKKYDDLDWDKLMDNFKSALVQNDYYGYTLLREFLTNPMRETPTLEKIGNNFRAVVNRPEVLLYIEPFDDNYAIDTIRSREIIQVCETGHDSYYFAEIERPVESPVAGADGYATLQGRSETIYGYVKKFEVKQYTDANLLAEFQTADTTKSKLGKINDPDGYVNIRKGMNAQSEILGKIQKTDVFNFWEIPGSNWCVVKTQNGILGFVYKDRIEVKTETGDWVILDED
ncbi:MAG: SH3 domain-containing protein [Candidatus Azobacteroides sp.]|nr:SH3 domain-containing protein [Candidatus Azobacteroides sp.]